MLKITGGRVIDPESGLDGIYDITIDKGIITEISARTGSAGGPGNAAAAEAAIQADAGCSLIDAAGLVVSPGLIDTHSHFRDPGQTHKEDIHTGSAAAVKGGYTSIIMMANTVPAIDSPAVLRDVLERGKQTPVHLYSCANVTIGMKGDEYKEARAILLRNLSGHAAFRTKKQMEVQTKKWAEIRKERREQECSKFHVL